MQIQARCFVLAGVLACVGAGPALAAVDDRKVVSGAAGSIAESPTTVTVEADARLRLLALIAAGIAAVAYISAGRDKS